MQSAARLLNLLEEGNIKLASVAGDVFGVSGMRMLEAPVEGGPTLAEMAHLAKGRLRGKVPQLEPALEGQMEEHHRDVLKLQLRRMRALDQDLAELEAQIQEKLKPYRPQLELLAEIPGVDWKYQQ